MILTGLVRLGNDAEIRYTAGGAQRRWRRSRLSGLLCGKRIRRTDE